ncbi:MAG: 1-hydroxy-2-methyl-2-butenyl 4-diphosphate reductase [Elusimicrobia bacterium]|nr:1-hydroxy-2-methyl-2-butenyl 4-diphosphate reductase [Elusimicrobiota bacterium]
MSGVLVAAATRWESEPIRRAAGSRPVTVLRTGMGPAAASAALAGLQARPGLVISAGFAGALQPDLRCGDLVAAELTPCPDPAAALRRLRPEVRFGAIAGSDRVLRLPAEKADLGRRTGALAVDMESAAVGGWARGRGLPALAVRVIFDELDRPLPALGWAAADPFSWPRLLALWPAQRRASAVLAAVMKALLEAL